MTRPLRFLLVALPLLAATPSVIAAPPAPNGAQIFAQRCAACHSVVAGKAATVGPNLAGVVGRAAASTTFNYSPALKASKLTWTKASLDQFLASPKTLVPGTRMVISVPDKAQRAAVIQYLSRPTP